MGKAGKLQPGAPGKEIVKEKRLISGFPDNWFKAEIVQLRQMEMRLKGQEKEVRMMRHAYRKKRNSVNEIRNLDFQLEGIKWLNFINNHVLDWLETEVKNAKDNKG